MHEIDKNGIKVIKGQGTPVSKGNDHVAWPGPAKNLGRMLPSLIFRELSLLSENRHRESQHIAENIPPASSSWPSESKAKEVSCRKCRRS